jgi:hypothetical protein
MMRKWLSESGGWHDKKMAVRVVDGMMKKWLSESGGWHER